MSKNHIQSVSMSSVSKISSICVISHDDENSRKNVFNQSHGLTFEGEKETKWAENEGKWMKLSRMYIHSISNEMRGETKFGLIDRDESSYRCEDGAFVLGTNSFLMYRSFLQAKANCSFRR